MAEILRGAPVAAALTEELKKRCTALVSAGTAPTLAIVRMGEHPDDIAYEQAAIKRCDSVGIRVKSILLPEDSEEAELLSLIRGINGDAHIHGCLLFRPLPPHIDERRVCESLSAEKDVDCMTAASLDGVFTGRNGGFAPCTAQAVMEMLSYYGVEPEGMDTAVIGRSLVIGQPIAMMLQRRNATVTICHSKTRNLPQICRRAELLVAAAGRAEMVDERYVNEKQIIIDVGINEGADGRICGDVDFEKAEPLVKAISPVPGGVGSVTTAVLCKHLIMAAEAAATKTASRPPHQ